MLPPPEHAEPHGADTSPTGKERGPRKIRGRRGRFGSPFYPLAERLRGLPFRTAQPTDEQARKEINAICVQAIRLYTQYADAGVSGFDAALVDITLTDDTQRNQDLLLKTDDKASRWLTIVDSVSKSHPGRIALNPGAPEVIVQHLPNIDLSKWTSGTIPPVCSQREYTFKSYPPKNWAQRANEYADVLDWICASNRVPVRARDWVPPWVKE